MTKLSVNINKVALLRNTRSLGIPDVMRLARIALEAGAHGITVHPRPDGRHIRAQDVRELATLLKDWPHAEFNIEGNPFYGLLDFAEEIAPAQCTLVPDEAGAFTSDHGWDLAREGDRLKPLIARIRKLGVRVSLFMDPTPDAMCMVRDAGADRVELYTEPYARAYGRADVQSVAACYAETAVAAQHCGLGVNAGHDLNLENIAMFLRSVPSVLEVSIGHALISDALELGLEKAVRKYLLAIRAGTST